MTYTYIEQLGLQSKTAFKELKNASTETKNKALTAISQALVNNTDAIIEANAIDMKNAKENGMSESLQDRLQLTADRIQSIANSVLSVVELNDPVGQVIRGNRLKNGLRVEQVREPLGTIAMIFEARPNVCVDAAVLSIKSGNTCILRGGKEAFNSNKALVETMRTAISGIIPENAILFVEELDHKYVDDILKAIGFIDLVIPRGSNRLIQKIVREARIPAIETGAGICHTYVAKTADFRKAIDIIVNAKASRPSVCNSLENVLVDETIATEFLPKMKAALDKVSVELRGDAKTCQIIEAVPATDEDFDTEYLDYILSCKVVKGVQEAIDFINTHSTKHSEAIVTENYTEANIFLDQVDSACVYVNASVRFSDGAEFGYGAEIGISTQKMHARGPIGLQELTTTKYRIYGDGQVRD